MPNEPEIDLAEARQLSADVFVMGFPLVLMDAVRRAHPIELNRILLLADNSPTLAPGLADEGVREVRTSAWIDVSERPMVMHLPHMHGRYFSVTLMDASGDPFASLGSHTGDAAGSDVAIVGPRWRGELSGPLKAVRSVTDVVWALSRITANSDADRPEAEALAARQALTPLHEAGEAARPSTAGRCGSWIRPAHTCVQQVMDMTPEMFTHRLNLLVERSAQGLRGAYWPTLRARLRALNELGKPGEIGVDSVARPHCVEGLCRRRGGDPGGRGACDQAWGERLANLRRVAKPRGRPPCPRGPGFHRLGRPRGGGCALPGLRHG